MAGWLAWQLKIEQSDVVCMMALYTVHRAGIITRCLTSLNLLRPFKPIISFNKISVLELPVLVVGWNLFRYSEQIEDQHLYTCIEIIVLHFISHLHDFIEFPVTKTALELHSPLRQACQTWFSTECLQEGNILSVVVEAPSSQQSRELRGQWR